MNKKITTFLTLSIIFLYACSKDGATGPAGPTGPTGATGPAGPTGPPGVGLITKTFNLTSANWRNVSSTYGFNNTYQADLTWTELTSDFTTNGMVIFYTSIVTIGGSQYTTNSQLPFKFWPASDNSYFREYSAIPSAGNVTFISYDSDNIPGNPSITTFRGVALKNTTGLSTKTIDSLIKINLIK